MDYDRTATNAVPVLTVTDLEDAHSLIDRSRISPLQMAVFGICFFIMALDGMDVLVVSYAAPSLAAEFGIAPGVLGVVFSAGLLGMAAGAMFIAPYADRIGRRAIILLPAMARHKTRPAATALTRFMRDK